MVRHGSAKAWSPVRIRATPDTHVVSCLDGGMVDTQDLKSCESNLVRVRVSLQVPILKEIQNTSEDFKVYLDFSFTDRSIIRLYRIYVSWLYMFGKKLPVRVPTHPNFICKSIDLYKICSVSTWVRLRNRRFVFLCGNYYKNSNSLIQNKE